MYEYSQMYRQFIAIHSKKYSTLVLFVSDWHAGSITVQHCPKGNSVIHSDGGCTQECFIYHVQILTFKVLLGQIVKNDTYVASVVSVDDTCTTINVVLPCQTRSWSCSKQQEGWRRWGEGGESLQLQKLLPSFYQHWLAVCKNSL